MKYLIIIGLSIFGITTLFVRNAHDISFFENVQNINVDFEISETDKQFDEYWYAGLAELSGYELKQSRYGEIHEGTATMIFVTEPFSKKKHVKLDDPNANYKDKVSVLKLNFAKNFLTGIYPYSLMTSVFNPIEQNNYINALKITLTGQEWCGHVFQQLNLKGKNYDLKSFSYFESEGDQEEIINKAMLEDELYNLIRINPELLPLGKIELVPSLVVNRFLHQELKPYLAEASIQPIIWNRVQVQQYSIRYLDNERTLNIYFHTNFPYIIEGWEDSYKGNGKEMLTSTAVRTNTKVLDYWNKNHKEDAYLHNELFEKMDISIDQMK